MNAAAADAVRDAREEYARLAHDHEQGRFLELCRAHARGVIEGVADGARHVADAALAALAATTPFMMIRLGDGEANLLSFALRPGDSEKRWVDEIFRIHDGRALSFADSLAVAGELRDLIPAADVVGVRALSPLPGRLQLDDIAAAIDAGNLRGALGMIGAFRHAERALRDGEFRNVLLTSAWVHLGLLEHLGRLLDAAPRVVVISGRTETEPLLRARLGERLDFLAIPLQASDSVAPRRFFHYPERYREILAALDRDLRGTLVLVGAGLLGKAYCAAARRHGAVALDLGSAFDVLAGARTRPVHSIPNFIDVERDSWLPAEGGAPDAMAGTPAAPAPSAAAALTFPEPEPPLPAAPGALRLAIAALDIGAARYVDVVVTVEGRSDGVTDAAPRGGARSGTTAVAAARYDPASGCLAMTAGAAGAPDGPTTVLKVGTLESIGGVSAADEFDGVQLHVPTVEAGGRTYRDVDVTVRRIVGNAGGMPRRACDSYDLATNRLYAPAVRYRGRVHTNVVFAVAGILSVDGAASGLPVSRSGSRESR